MAAAASDAGALCSAAAVVRLCSEAAPGEDSEGPAVLAERPAQSPSESLLRSQTSDRQRQQTRALGSDGMDR